MTNACYHCNEANCVAVCPAEAITKQGSWTLINHDKCIGCGACVNECKYRVPQVSDNDHVNDVGQKMVLKDKSHKCNACKVNERDVPACVKTCPSGALQFGDRSKLIKEAKAQVKMISKDFPHACIYGLSEFGGLGVITILRESPEVYGLPIGNNAKQIDLSKAEEIKDTYTLLASFSFGVPALKRTAYKIAKSLMG